MQDDEAIADGEAAEVDTWPIHVEDSSPKPLAKNKKPKKYWGRH